MEFSHYSVMLSECINGLAIRPNGIYIDATLGGGGHSLEIVKKLASGGRLICVDKDEEAILAAKSRLADYLDKITFVNDDFKNTFEHLDKLGIDKIDGVLLDLGVSSYQLDNIERGFCYSQDAMLDMRMNPRQAVSAKTIINTYDEQSLARIIWEYGEEKFSRKIAANIVKARSVSPIETTFQLAKLVENSIPMSIRWKGGNPSKRTFQAIRIEVNGELDGLEAAIETFAMRLAPEGKICVITFHSLEDRIVKRIYQELEKECICPPRQPICTCNKRQEILIETKKPLTASEEELKTNSRSQSAKLRIAKRK